MSPKPTTCDMCGDTILDDAHKQPLVSIIDGMRYELFVCFQCEQEAEHVASPTRQQYEETSSHHSETDLIRSDASSDVVP